MDLMESWLNVHLQVLRDLKGLMDTEKLSDLPRLFVCLWRPTEQSHEAWICRVSSDEMLPEHSDMVTKTEESTNSGCAYIALMH